MQRSELHAEILECVLVILMIGQFGKAVGWLLTPLSNWLLSRLPGGAGMINHLLWGELIQCGVIFFLICFFWRYCHQRSWRDLGLAKSDSAHWLVLAIGNGFALFAVMMLLSMLMNALLPQGLPPQNVAAVIGKAATPWEKLVPLLVTGVLAPIREEMLFRGFIYQSLRCKFSTGMSIMLSAAVFGCMHLDPVRVLPLMLGGIWLNILYVKTNSLYVPMVAHGVWNVLMTAIIYWT